MNCPENEAREILVAEARRLSALRMQMVELHPFWGYLLLQVKLVAAPQLPSFAATDCLHHIWYNPLLTRHLDVGQLGFVLAHEAGHQLLASEQRRQGRMLHLWNCATDYAINRIVAAIRNPARPGSRLYTLPEVELPGVGRVRVLHDPRWDGMVAEVIYEHLAAEALPAPVSVTLELPDEGGPARSRPDGSGSEGAGGDGASSLRIPNLTDHCGGIDIHLPDNLSPQQQEELLERINGAVETWQRQEQAGDMPGELVREILLRHRAVVPWKRLFRQYAGLAVAQDDYSLVRPNKRYLEEGFVVPGRYSERAGRVVVSLDTSGSMTHNQLQVVGAELAALHEAAVEMTLIVADSAVREVVGPEELDGFLRSGHLRGGGGTDHRPVFEWIAAHLGRPDLYIGLTDLFTCFPERKPPYPVIWLVPREHGKPPWGRVIEVEGD